MTGHVINKLRALLSPKNGHMTNPIEDFIHGGYIPWTRGYEQYKWDAIETEITTGSFNNHVGTSKYGYRIDERIVEIPWFMSRLPHGKSRLLDAGSALNHKPILTQPVISEKKLFISTLAPEPKNFLNLGISYIYEDLRETCFRSEYFDHIACISTLEHVGLNNTMLYTNDLEKREEDANGYIPLINVFHSILKPGGKLFITVPFGKKRIMGGFRCLMAQ